MMYSSNQYDRLVLGQLHRMKIRAMALRYPLREVAGIIMGAKVNREIISQEIVFGANSGWRSHNFSLQGGLLDTIFDRSVIGRKRIACLFHAHPGGCLMPSLWDAYGMAVTKIPWLIFTCRDATIKCEAFVLESGVLRNIPVVHR